MCYFCWILTVHDCVRKQFLLLLVHLWNLFGSVIQKKSCDSKPTHTLCCFAFQSDRNLAVVVCWDDFSFRCVSWQFLLSPDICLIVCEFVVPGSRGREPAQYGSWPFRFVGENYGAKYWSSGSLNSIRKWRKALKCSSYEVLMSANKLYGCVVYCAVKLAPSFGSRQQPNEAALLSLWQIEKVLIETPWPFVAVTKKAICLNLLTISFVLCFAGNYDGPFVTNNIVHSRYWRHRCDNGAATHHGDAERYRDAAKAPVKNPLSRVRVGRGKLLFDGKTTKTFQSLQRAKPSHTLSIWDLPYTLCEVLARKSSPLHHALKKI